MMQRIVNTSRSFAYVPNLDTYNAHVGDIALKAVLKEVEFLPDGRCLLEAKLEGRYRILEHFGTPADTLLFCHYPLTLSS
jgi:hypothetical protein